MSQKKKIPWRAGPLTPTLPLYGCFQCTERHMKSISSDLSYKLWGHAFAMQAIATKEINPLFIDHNIVYSVVHLTLGKLLSSGLDDVMPSSKSAKWPLTANQEFLRIQRSLRQMFTNLEIFPFMFYHSFVYHKNVLSLWDLRCCVPWTLNIFSFPFPCLSACERSGRRSEDQEGSDCG